MISRLGTDLAAALRRDGVPVTLGAATANARVGAVDDLSAGDGSTSVRVQQRGVRLILVTGSLTGLALSARITVTAGPLAGTYTVDELWQDAGGNSTEVVAR